MIPGLSTHWTQHVFREPGGYLVKVERSNERGEKATYHLWVPVRE